MTTSITVNIHSSIRIGGERVIYIDPFKLDKAPHDADIILITHEHFDHYSPEDIARAAKDDTVFIMPESMKGKPVPGNAIYMNPYENTEILGIKLKAVPSYNVDKPMHKKKYGWLGYIVTTGGRDIYIAGDTDINEDVLRVKTDVAIVPVGGTYTMNAVEAAQLVNAIHPLAAIPVHYGDIVGSKNDGRKFAGLVDRDIKTELML